MKKQDKKVYSAEESIYWDIEPHLLYDYVGFANLLRPFQATNIPYKLYNMKQDAKRWCLVLLTETYQKSLEDLAAILLGLYRRYNDDLSCAYQKKFNKRTPIIYTLINYETKEATLKKVIDKFSSPKEFIEGLHIDDLEKVNIKAISPALDVEKFYCELYKDIVDWKKDQEKRFRIYNKIKHGPVIFGSAQILNSKNPNSPAVIYVDHSTKLTDHPLIVHSLHFTEDEFLLLQSGAGKISDCIRNLLAIYLCKNYPDFLKKKGFSSPLLFFKERRPRKK